MSYESDWLDISSYVISYGSLTTSYGDEAYPGSVQIDGTTLVLNNSDRRFNDGSDYSSLWSGYKTRYRTKFKIEYGFYYEDYTEIEGKVFYGILYSDPINTAVGTIDFSIAPLIKVLQNYPATGVATTSGTTATLVSRLLTKTVNGARIFDQYFEGATDGDKYKINVAVDSVTTIPNPSFRDDETVWKKISDYCLYDNFTAYVDNSGAFVFEKREETATTQWVFNGPGSFDNDYGVNIVSIDSESNGFDQVFTRVAIEYGDNAFATQSITWTPGDASFPDIYGERTYSGQFYDLTSGTAATIATNILTVTKTPHRRWEITTPVIPHLQINDKVELNYVGLLVPATGVFTLGVSVLGGTDVLGKRTGSINLNGVAAKITSATLNIDSDTCTFRLQEL